LSIIACGSSDQSGGTDSAGQTASGGLTADQLRNGIGPIRSVALEDLNSELASTGEAIFQTKCSACHKFDARYVGPALGDVLDRRSPEFIMNMMLNPAEMVEKHPEVKALLAQFLTPMPNQNLTEADARAVLEYLRAEAAGGEESETN
ncbi:MAG: cytochrome c, partial [Rhodothermales bacterium]|nr:cytochrome c [Rhodothermales bacterium]